MTPCTDSGLTDPSVGIMKRLMFPPATRREGGRVEPGVLPADPLWNPISPMAHGDGVADPCLGELELAAPTDSGAKTSGDGVSGGLLALLDSYGHLEVAPRAGNVATALTAGPGTPVIAKRKTL